MTLKRITRFVVNSFLLRRLRGPFEREGKHGWVAHVPEFRHLADGESDSNRSPLAVYEDGVALRPAHSSHDEIRIGGLGAYSHWGDHVYFSTFDNSDPNTNGRTYQYSLSPWLYERRVACFGPAKVTTYQSPVNHRPRDAGPAQIRADVEYALSVGGNFLKQVRRFVPSLAGKTMLEVGPGINYGCVMMLAAYGARPMVADRFLAPWEKDYHSAFYTAFADEVARQDPDADVRPIRALVEAGGYPPEVLGRYESALEQIAVASNSVDVVFSNAVVEHLYDLEASFAQLYRITKPGGVGLHQVDHRDHRDFSRPLEYLLMTENEFRDEFDRRHSECGNRWRPDEADAFYRGAGFDIIDFTGNIFADPTYLADFVPRLRAASKSRYRDRPVEELSVISGFFRVRKPG